MSALYFLDMPASRWAFQASDHAKAGYIEKNGETGLQWSLCGSLDNLITTGWTRNTPDAEHALVAAWAERFGH